MCISIIPIRLPKTPIQSKVVQRKMVTSYREHIIQKKKYTFFKLLCPPPQKKKKFLGTLLLTTRLPTWIARRTVRRDCSRRSVRSFPFVTDNSLLDRRSRLNTLDFCDWKANGGRLLLLRAAPRLLRLTCTTVDGKNCIKKKKNYKSGRQILSLFRGFMTPRPPPRENYSRTFSVTTLPTIQ